MAFHFPAMIWPAISANGLLAVDFFFCLSGFVIAFSYEKRLAEALPLKDFFVTRWIRLYPIYFLGSLVGLLVAIFVDHMVDRSNATPWVWFYVLALFIWPARLSVFTADANFPLDGPSWSLFYEMVANVVYALLVKLRVAQTAVFLGISLVCFSLMALWVLHGATVDVGYLSGSFGRGFARIGFSFSAGVLVYRLYRSTAHQIPEFLSHWIAPALVIACLSAILISPLQWMRTELFRLFAIGFCLPPLVYLGALCCLPHRFGPTCGTLGELSYPLYLLHFPFVSMLSGRHIMRFFVLHHAISRVGMMLSLVLAVLLSRWVGEHLDLPVRRFLTRRYNLSKLHAPPIPESNELHSQQTFAGTVSREPADKEAP